MNARKKAGAVYLITAAIVLVCWIGNVVEYESSQLPKAGFLRHHIEASDGEGFSFFLLYVANRQDSRQIASVSVDDVPYLRFYPPTVQSELQHQKIYRVMAQMSSLEERPDTEQEPVVIHTVNVQYTDGTTSREDIGEIRIYREEAAVSDEQRPVRNQSSSSSSDGSGYISMIMKRPATLIGVTSAWLPVLGDAFEWHAIASGDRVDLPAKLSEGQSADVSYRFRLPADHPLSMDVFQLILRMPFQEGDGKTYTAIAFAAYTPYPSESEMKSYVRAQRRAKA